MSLVNAICLIEIRKNLGVQMAAPFNYHCIVNVSKSKSIVESLVYTNAPINQHPISSHNILQKYLNIYLLIFQDKTRIRKTFACFLNSIKIGLLIFCKNTVVFEKKSEYPFLYSIHKKCQRVFF